MIDTDEITKRLDNFSARLYQMEQAQAQNFELFNIRLEHIDKKLDMMAEQVNWICKVLSRRFTGMPEEDK